MSKICQEKFQVKIPDPKTDGSDQWATDDSARVKKNTPKGSNSFFNSLPPGMDIEDQEATDQRVMPLVMSGESDVAQDWNPGAVRDGFTRRTMRPTDDMYTGEHCDLFYADAKVDGEVGFVERGNLLDRL